MLLLAVILLLGLRACDDRLLPPTDPGGSGPEQREPLIYLNTFPPNYDPFTDVHDFGEINVTAVRPDGGNGRLIMSGKITSSPQKGRIALISRGPDGQGMPGIWLANEDGTEAAPLEIDPANEVLTMLAWTLTLGPDGRTVAWISENPNGTYELRINSPVREVSIDLNMVQASTALTDIAPPSFSPDGRWIAFVNSYSGRMPEFELVSPTTGARRTIAVGLVSSLSGIVPAFDWSADSRRLLYVGVIGNDSVFGGTELMAHDIDAGTTDTLTNDGEFKELPRWLASGGVCYIGMDGNGWDLYMIDQGRNRRRLTFDNVIKTGLSIGPDGHTALYTQLDYFGKIIGSVRTFDLATQTPGPILSPSTDIAFWRR